MFSYITTESGFTHQIRTDCRRSSTENGQTAAGKPQLETAARESVFPRFATLHSEKQIRYCVYFRFRGFFDCTYLDISNIKFYYFPLINFVCSFCYPYQKYKIFQGSRIRSSFIYMFFEEREEGLNFYSLFSYLN